MLEQLSALFLSPAFYQSVLRLATPLLLACMGGILAERSGTMNLAQEGLMVIGAFFGFAGSYFSGSPWVGLLLAMAMALLVGMLHAFSCVSLGLNQAVVAVALNITCTGIAGTLMRVLFGATTSTLSCNGFSAVSLPVLGDIPVVGRILFQQHILTYLALLLIPAVWFLFFKTTLGLRIRSVGENPKASGTMGVGVLRVRYLSLMASYLTAGLAGASLTICGLNTYTDNIVAGRGYIAFSAVVFGKFHPVGAALGALLFGFADTLQLNMQTIGVDIPYQIMLLFPYALTLAALLLMGAGASPRSWAQPYFPEGE